MSPLTSPQTGEKEKPTPEENDRLKLLRNRGLVDLDVLDKFAGLWVLWSPDGAEILASGKTPLEARDNAIRERNIQDPSPCVLEYIPEYDTVIPTLSEG
jgi:hypothetical protein